MKGKDHIADLIVTLHTLESTSTLTILKLLTEHMLQPLKRLETLLMNLEETQKWHCCDFTVNEFENEDRHFFVDVQ